jgi:hypothetical protein
MFDYMQLVLTLLLKSLLKHKNFCIEIYFYRKKLQEIVNFPRSN